jgi:hypothetical protein
VDYAGSEFGPVADSSKYINDPLDILKMRNFFTSLMNVTFSL